MIPTNIIAKLSLLPICQKCGVRCCIYGTPMVSAEEKRRIIKYSGKDCFEKKGNYYIIPKNPCPYLTKNNLCSIEEVKPIDCAVYPVGAIYKNSKVIAGISQKCPSKFLLSKQFITLAKKCLNDLSKPNFFLKVIDYKFF